MDPSLLWRDNVSNTIFKISCPNWTSWTPSSKPWFCTVQRNGDELARVKLGPYRESSNPPTLSHHRMQEGNPPTHHTGKVYNKPFLNRDCLQIGRATTLPLEIFQFNNKQRLIPISCLLIFGVHRPV
jgi:hypothetical protein